MGANEQEADTCLTLNISLRGIFRDRSVSFYLKDEKLRTPDEALLVSAFSGTYSELNRPYSCSIDADPRVDGLKVDLSMAWDASSEPSKADASFVVPYYKDVEQTVGVIRIKATWTRLEQVIREVQASNSD